MTKQEFQDLCKDYLFLDGATGSCLMAAGMPRGACTEEWVLEHKDILQELQRAYAAAGSQVLYAPTFGGNRLNLRRHGLEDRLEELNRALVGYSREVAEGSSHKVYVAGDITTTGEMMDPMGDLTSEEALEIYKEQVLVLAEAGVDFIAAETMINIEECLAAVEAVKAVSDLPVLCTVTVDAQGRLFTGGDAISAAKAFEQAGASAVGVNCSVGPEQLPEVIRGIKGAVSLPVVAKPNAGTPRMDSAGRAVYNTLPEDFARAMKKLAEEGAVILGGCCGTTPDFIKALVKCIRQD